MKAKHQVRERFRSLVFTRDRNRCVICGASNVKLDAHHITNRNLMPNGGYVLENGITLCDQPGGCHEKAEAAAPGFSPEELYARIRSSCELAEAKSRLL